MPGPTDSIWTQAKQDTLRSLWALEFAPGVPLYSATEIAQKLGSSKGQLFTKGMVIGKAHRMKLPARARRNVPEWNRGAR